MLYREYDPNILQKLQDVECEILKDFDTFCRENGIEYFGCGGTLLGAVRHGGFIPWDDDIDVGMTREHYDRFLEIARREPKGKYHLMNAQVDASFPVMISKWYQAGTKFRDEDAVTCGYESGIAVDIFCFDNVADDEQGLRRQAMQAWIFGKLLVLRQIAEPTVYADGWKAKTMLLVSKLINRLLKMFRVSPEYLYRKANEAAVRYRDENTRRVAFLFDPTPYTSMLRRSDIYPVRKLMFEGMELSFPRRPHVYLRTRYGKNYMELPPEDKRHNHPPAELDFGNGEQSES
ncbi:LicD family protein [Ruminococcus sp. OA3]|uniref:LicD family protein n=1 Tax=Ruminococcus sp. OA3 TaxID=2914164 RepID=UPI001F0650CF|nr:LicD family protein [Ruminococcus sp. OA3]MCH1982177.1 LicD family protein [Ruminococcus sp. OA3]